MTGAEPASDGRTATMNDCSVAPNGFSARMTTSTSPGCSGVHVTSPVSESMVKPAGALGAVKIRGPAPLTLTVSSASYAYGTPWVASVMGTDVKMGGPATPTSTVKHCVSSPATLTARTQTPTGPATSGVQVMRPVVASMAKPGGDSNADHTSGVSPAA